MYNSGRNPQRKSDSKLDFFKGTINRIIVLMQTEQNNYNNATDSLSQAISGAKVQAYQTVIDILSAQLKSYRG
jgi:flagellar biosynthesis chaperone FliJ